MQSSLHSFIYQSSSNTKIPAKVFLVAKIILIKETIWWEWQNERRNRGKFLIVMWNSQYSNVMREMWEYKREEKKKRNPSMDQRNVLLKCERVCLSVWVFSYFFFFCLFVNFGSDFIGCSYLSVPSAIDTFVDPTFAMRLKWRKFLRSHIEIHIE